MNVDGVKAVTAGSSRLGAHLTFISTDYVFDGTRGPYAETDTTRPINVYGEQKLEAEQLVRIRLTPWLSGPARSLARTRGGRTSCFERWTRSARAWQ